MLEEFKKYVDMFYTGEEDNDSGIRLKYNHSLRVMDLMEKMALKFNIDVEEARIIGLLHDYGRFYQWKNYHTFNDNISVDHALYGVQKLFDEGEIKRFYFKDENYDEVREAIYYHNKYQCLEKDLCNMIRDADKLDILYLFTGETSFNEEGDISLEVKKIFDNEKLINYKNVVSNADDVIKTLAYIYDLNYLFSFKYLKENDIIGKIYEQLEDKEKFKYYFDKINDYIKERIQC